MAVCTSPSHNLGTQGLDALAAWTSNHRPVYQSIDDAGVVTTIQTPVS